MFFTMQTLASLCEADENYLIFPIEAIPCIWSVSTAFCSTCRKDLTAGAGAKTPNFIPKKLATHTAGVKAGVLHGYVIGSAVV